MAIVKWASECDFDLIHLGATIHKDCRRRSEEYEEWPSCVDCGGYTCPEHMNPGSASEDEDNECVCLACAK